MKLSTRLMLLVLGCLLPVLGAQIYAQVSLYRDRHARLETLVLQQAEQDRAAMENLIDGVRHLGALVGQSPALRTPGAACDARLTAIRDAFARYRFIALVSATENAPLCASRETPATLVLGQPDGVGKKAGDHAWHVGKVVEAGTPDAAYLPIVVPVEPGSDRSPRRLVVGLRTAWVRRHLRARPREPLTRLPAAAAFVIDRQGNIITEIETSAHVTPARRPDWARALADESRPGVMTLALANGQPALVGYAPWRMPASSLTMLDAVMIPSDGAGFLRLTYPSMPLSVAALVAALIVAGMAGYRFFSQPTTILLEAVRKWREGDLTARVPLLESGSEFASLAQSFNAMAAGLQTQEANRHQQAGLLESQIAERTRELSETNNRLQVEIAGREKTEIALHQAQKLQAVGQLAGGIAHDFNNMLATVLGNLELMERRVAQASDNWSDADTERLQRLIERATTAVTRGSQLTSRLLAFSRRQSLSARPTDVNMLLGELITLASSTLGRRIRVVAELAENLWAALVDPSQLEAAILNVCLNARDAMPDGGTLTLRTRNATVQEGDTHDLVPGEYVQVHIIDTGTGMSPEVRARAFDPFFTTKGPGAGPGLGLSQVYGMARQSGGVAWIDSTPGEGTCITLALPRATPAPVVDAMPAVTVSKDVTPNGTPRELVLVVDDDHAVRQVTVEMARDLGCDVVQAPGGEQALGLITQITPTLLLLDYAMPGMNGLQLAQAMRRRGIAAPIALVTGYAEISRADIVAADVAGLLRKPFTIRDLETMLDRLRGAEKQEAIDLETGMAHR